MISIDLFAETSPKTCDLFAEASETCPFMFVEVEPIFLLSESIKITICIEIRPKCQQNL